MMITSNINNDIESAFLEKIKIENLATVNENMSDVLTDDVLIIYC